ncbi:MAG: cyanophycin synthetase [Pseudomonadota bacterium]|jgi:cyanophycin synthetase
MKTKDIVIRSTRLLKGPNFWTAVYVPMIEALVDIGELEQFPSNKIPGLYERLKEWLPGLIEHRCSPGCRGGFLMRLEEGTWPGHILEHVTLELQTQAGLPAGFGRTRESTESGVYKLVFQTPNDIIGQEALHSGRNLLMAAIQNHTYDVEAAIRRVQLLVDRHYLGPSTAYIVKAAQRKGIPHLRLDERSNLVQLGYGKAQRRIWTAESDQTGAIGEAISRDKPLTKKLLNACGVLVPDGCTVKNAQEAWKIAQSLGLPVVVKPEDGNHGRGVFTNLFTESEVVAAYAVAIEEGSGVIVERYIHGNEHRLLVVGGKFVAAAKGEAECVIGDGQQTVAQLIESQINAAEHRGHSERHTLNLIRLGSAVLLELEKQGLTPDSVPSKGESVLIQRSGNVSVDCTAEVHPDVIATVEMAAKVVGLDIAGIDLVADDISQPLAAQGGAIVEVNAGPGLLMHAQPSEGEPRPVGDFIVDHLFPNDGKKNKGRIPLVGISGSFGKTSVARMCARVLRAAGLNTGLACTDGLFLGERLLATQNGDSYAAAQRLLVNPSLEAAVIETSDMQILQEGMAYDFCDVGIVMNLQLNPAIKPFDLHDEDDQFKVLRTQVDVVIPSGDAVLNAEDVQVADMARLSEGGVVFFALNPADAVLTEHCANGGRAVTIQDEQIVWRHGEIISPLMPVADVPVLPNQALHHARQNVMATLAMGQVLGLPLALVQQGIYG